MMWVWISVASSHRIESKDSSADAKGVEDRGRGRARARARAKARARGVVVGPKTEASWCG